MYSKDHTCMVDGWCDNDRCTQHVCCKQSTHNVSMNVSIVPKPHTNIYKSIVNNQDNVYMSLEKTWDEVEWIEDLNFKAHVNDMVNTLEPTHSLDMNDDDDGLEFVICEEVVISDVVVLDSEGHLHTSNTDCNAIENPESDIMLQVANSKFMYT